MENSKVPEWIKKPTSVTPPPVTYIKPALIVTVGIPASGKTTFAKGLATQEGCFEICKDDLRAKYPVKTWTKDYENMIRIIERDTVSHLLRNKHDVVVHDTNCGSRDIAYWSKIAKDCSARLEIAQFAIDLKTAIEYDSKREKPVGEEVVRKIAKYAEQNGFGHLVLYLEKEEEE